MNHHLRKNQLLLFCLTLFWSSAVFSGCSHTPGSEKQRTDVSIAITSGGEPVTVGMVNLENPTTGEGGGGELTDEGKVIIPNVVLGNYSVTIVAPDPDPVPPEPGKPAPPKKTFKNVPKKFRASQTSPLKVDVKDESREFSFDLKDAS